MKKTILNGKSKYKRNRKRMSIFPSFLFFSFLFLSPSVLPFKVCTEKYKQSMRKISISFCIFLFLYPFSFLWVHDKWIKRWMIRVYKEPSSLLFQPFSSHLSLLPFVFRMITKSKASKWYKKYWKNMRKVPHTFSDFLCIQWLESDTEIIGR